MQRPGTGLEHAEMIFALSIEAFRAPMGAYDPALDDLYGDPYEAEALRSLRAYLEGVDSAGRRFHQAPVELPDHPSGSRPKCAGRSPPWRRRASVSLRAVTDDSRSSRA